MANSPVGARGVLYVQLVGIVDRQVLLTREYRLVVDAISFAHTAADRLAGQHARVSHRKYYVIRPILPVGTVTGLD